VDSEAIKNNEDLYNQTYKKDSEYLNNYAKNNYKIYKEKVEGIYGEE
jgi:hypothetical protein